MSRTAPYEPIPFTNTVGQTIYLGGDVIFITTGFNHRTTARRGIYLGRDTSPNPKVRVSSIKTVVRWKNKNTNEPQMPKYDYSGLPRYSYTDLEAKSLYYEARDEMEKKAQEGLHQVTEDVEETICLRLNRVYGIS